MYLYLAYGLGIHSAIPLFDIPSHPCDRDVDIVLERIDLNNLEIGAAPPYMSLTPQEAILVIEDVGRFKVSGGNKIVVDPDDLADRALLQRYIIGACMALLLYQRNQLVLHASAIEINRQGVAFMGASGAGKSSIAAAFLAAGHRMIVDDVTSIDSRDGLPYIYQGFPYIKLVNDNQSLSQLKHDYVEYSDHLEDKTGFRIREDITGDKIPLSCIFVIKPGRKIESHRYDYKQALIELVRYSLPPSLVRLDRSAHFNRCVQVVNSIPIVELVRAPELEKLADLVGYVERYMSEHKHNLRL